MLRKFVPLLIALAMSPTMALAETGNVGIEDVSNLQEIKDAHGKTHSLGLINKKQKHGVLFWSPKLAKTSAKDAGFDLRAKNCVAPIRDQSNCGSCWAFAATGALESQVLLSQSTSMDLAEQILVSCSGAGSCAGGYPSSASSYIQSTGLPGESSYPYTATNGSCSNALASWQNNTQKIWSYLGVSANASAIETAISTYGPVVTTFAVYNDFS